MKSDFKSIKIVLENILKENKLDDVYYNNLILESWDKLVPKAVSAISKPQHFEKNVLRLRAATELWARELSLQKNKLKNMINHNLSQNLIDEIIIEK